MDFEDKIMRLTERANKLWNPAMEDQVICICIYTDSGGSSVSLELMDAKGPVRNLDDEQPYNEELFEAYDLWEALDLVEEFMDDHESKKKKSN